MNSLEQRTKVHYHCLVETRDTGVPHKTETAIIEDAYFGRHPSPSLSGERAPLGLNINIKYQIGTTGATYTDMKSIERLMDDFNATRPEELKGREVVAHEKGNILLGLSVPAE